MQFSGYCTRENMAKNVRSKYQGEVIQRYYENLDVIMLRRLQELVTGLYLADDARKNQLWERARKAMMKLKVNSAIIDHIMEKRNVEILAKNLQDWLSTKRKE